MDNNIKIGYAYGIVHLLVEVISFQILYKYFGPTLSLPIALFFDFFAFVPQGLFGLIADKYKKFNLGILGCFSLLISLVIFYTNSTYYLLGLFLLCIGNAIIHEAGAVATTTVCNGKLSHSAIFVAGGSFGVIIGQTLGNKNFSLIASILSLIIITLIILKTNKYWLKENRIIPKFDLIKKGNTIGLIILIAFFIVVARSFIGYAIPISWKKELWQSFLLFFTMGLGKALGGILSDKYGAKKIGIISTLSCIPFLLIGNNFMLLSIIGVFLFSFTMSITFGILVNVFQSNPGFAFGITTIGLFIGLLPIFIFGNLPIEINSILIIILSILSAIGLNKILK